MNPLDWWKCGDDVLCLKSTLWWTVEVHTIEQWSIVRHDYGWYTFSRKQVSQMVQCLVMMWRCHSVDVWKLAEVVCNDQIFVAWIISKEPIPTFTHGSVRTLCGCSISTVIFVLSMQVRHLFNVVSHISFHAGPVQTHVLTKFKDLLIPSWLLCKSAMIESLQLVRITTLSPFISKSPLIESSSLKSQ